MELQLRFVGHIHFMGHQFPVEFAIPLGMLDEPGLDAGSPNQPLGPSEPGPAEPGSPNPLPVEIRPHTGRQITRRAVAAAGSDAEKESLLGCRFPWLADCFSAAPADPVDADLQRLADLPPETLLKPDGTINKSAVARELGYSPGGGKWEYISELAARVRSRLLGEAA